MDFSLDDDHLALRDAVRRYCDDAYPSAQRGDADSDELGTRRWRGLAELGLLGLPFDDAVGGSALGAVQTMLVATELGRALAGDGWLASVVLAGGLLAELGTPAQRSQWLARVVDGSLRLALAADEAGARGDPFAVETRARRDGDGWRLDGRKCHVLDGERAGLLLVLARTDGAVRDRHGLTLFALDPATPGVRLRGHATLDDRRCASVLLDDVRVGPSQLLGQPGQAADAVDAAFDRLNAALVADATGAMEALLDMTLEHLRTRSQFGVPLARFQALQHRVADLAIALEHCKSMACAAAVAVDEGQVAARSRIVSAAKAFVAPLARRAAFDAIQLHGAMGMTDECRASHYARHLLTLALIGGDAASHLRRMTMHAPTSNGITQGDLR